MYWVTELVWVNISDQWLYICLACRMGNSVFSGEIRNLWLWSCWLSVYGLFLLWLTWLTIWFPKVRFSFLYLMNAVSFGRGELCSSFKHLLCFCSVGGPVLRARNRKRIIYLTLNNTFCIYLCNLIWPHHPCKMEKDCLCAHNTKT